jgi:hypothetical protein
VSADHFSAQAEDGGLDSIGSPHLTYYWAPLHLSFVWNGVSEAIDVCHGGYGEPVSLRVPSLVTKGTPAEVLAAFRNHCADWMRDPRRWKELVDAGVVACSQDVRSLVPPEAE